MILTSTHHIRFGWLRIGSVIQYRCIQVRCMKQETNQQSHMLLWPKMVSDRGLLLLEVLNSTVITQVRFGWVQTGSAKSCHPLNFKLDYWSSSTTGLNFQTGPGSGSARFRFELQFRTELWHHYPPQHHQSQYPTLSHMARGLFGYSRFSYTVKTLILKRWVNQNPASKLSQCPCLREPAVIEECVSQWPYLGSK